MTTDEMLNRMNGELDIDLYQVIEAKLRASEHIVKYLDKTVMQTHGHKVSYEEVLMLLIDYDKAGAEP